MDNTILGDMSGIDRTKI